MDAHTHEYKYVKDTSESQFKDAMRYRRLKFFLDTLVIMDKHKGSLHFTDSADFDSYIDTLSIGPIPLTAKDITKHALKMLEDEFGKIYKEPNK